MIEGDQDSLAVWIRNVRIACDRELRNVRYPVSESAAGNGEVEIKLSIRRVIRIEGHPEQTLLASVSVNPVTVRNAVELSVPVKRFRIEIPVLLHDKQSSGISRRSCHVERLSQTGSDLAPRQSRRRSCCSPDTEIIARTKQQIAVFIVDPLCCERCEQLPVNPIESPIAENYHDIVFFAAKAPADARSRRHSFRKMPAYP